MAEITVQKRHAIKEIINNNFTFSDLSPKFENVDSSTGNIFCPFHENHSTPAAKMYWDEVRGIWIIHCFGECHRNFTAYDYIDKILCEKYQQYKSPLDFLKNKLPLSDLHAQFEFYEKQQIDSTQSFMQNKINYINNVYFKYENIVDYIEELYTN